MFKHNPRTCPQLTLEPCQGGDIPSCQGWIPRAKSSQCQPPVAPHPPPLACPNLSLSRRYGPANMPLELWAEHGVFQPSLTLAHKSPKLTPRQGRTTAEKRQPTRCPPSTNYPKAMEGQQARATTTGGTHKDNDTGNTQGLGGRRQAAATTGLQKPSSRGRRGKSELQSDNTRKTRSSGAGGKKPRNAGKQGRRKNKEGKERRKKGGRGASRQIQGQGDPGPRTTKRRRQWGRRRKRKIGGKGGETKKKGKTTGRGGRRRRQGPGHQGPEVTETERQQEAQKGQETEETETKKK